MDIEREGGNVWRKGLTRKQLAEITNLSISTIARFEDCGRAYDYRINSLDKIARGLRVSIADLFKPFNEPSDRAENPANQ